ncbi:DUF5977 domain-containing protein [Pedobacter sp. NJ-S-72]
MSSNSQNIQSNCIIGPAFSLAGAAYFIDTTVNFQAVFSNPQDQQSILAYQWYLNSVLVIDERRDFSGKIYCGQHAIGLRLLSKEGWSGIKTLLFTTCKVPISTLIQGPDVINEGDSAIYQIVQVFSDGTAEDLTSKYIFSTTKGATFTGNTLQTIRDDHDFNDQTLTITATLSGSSPITKQVVVKNTSPYLSAEIAENVIRNNCQVGFEGTSVLYKIAAGAFNSRISQADADNKARALFDQNKQEYANANGTCIQTKFWNTVQSQTFMRNNCNLEFTGSTVIYKVAAYTYTANTQDAANQLALNDILANGQNYANTQGICTVSPVEYEWIGDKTTSYCETTIQEETVFTGFASPANPAVSKDNMLFYFDSTLNGVIWFNPVTLTNGTNATLIPIPAQVEVHQGHPVLIIISQLISSILIRFMEVDYR